MAANAGGVNAQNLFAMGTQQAQPMQPQAQPQNAGGSDLQLWSSQYRKILPGVWPAAPGGDREPAAVEQQTPVNSVRNAENRDHKHCGRNNVWIQ